MHHICHGMCRKEEARLRHTRKRDFQWNLPLASIAARFCWCCSSPSFSNVLSPSPGERQPGRPGRNWGIASSRNTITVRARPVFWRNPGISETGARPVLTVWGILEFLWLHSYCDFPWRFGTYLNHTLGHGLFLRRTVGLPPVKSSWPYIQAPQRCRTGFLKKNFRPPKCQTNAKSQKVWYYKRYMNTCHNIIPAHNLAYHWSRSR